jgi:hypothetical protein
MLDAIYGVLVLFHGLVHLAWFAPNQPEEYPFKWHSLLLARVPDETIRRWLSPFIVAQTVLFTLAALGVWGVPLLSGLWVPFTVAGVAISTMVMVLLWHPWFVTGPAVNLLIIGKALWDLGLIKQ